jgi:hypothetical protein
MNVNLRRGQWWHKPDAMESVHEGHDHPVDLERRIRSAEILNDMFQAHGKAGRPRSISATC